MVFCNIKVCFISFCIYPAYYLLPQHSLSWSIFTEDVFTSLSRLLIKILSAIDLRIDSRQTLLGTSSRLCLSINTTFFNLSVSQLLIHLTFAIYFSFPNQSIFCYTEKQRRGISDCPAPLQVLHVD